MYHFKLRRALHRITEFSYESDIRIADGNKSFPNIGHRYDWRDGTTYSTYSRPPTKRYYERVTERHQQTRNQQACHYRFDYFWSTDVRSSIYQLSFIYHFSLIFTNGIFCYQYLLSYRYFYHLYEHHLLSICEYLVS